MEHLGIPPIPTFSTHGENQAERWLKWKESFEFYAEALGLVDEQRKRAFLLHTAGTDIQNVYKTFVFELAEGVTKPSFQQVIAKLDHYFLPKRNVTYERHQFRTAGQTGDEGADAFITRLRRLSLYCEYEAATEEHVRDQFIANCRSAKLRRRLLREPDLTLDRLITIAQTAEASDRQANVMEQKEKVTSDEQLNYVKSVSTTSKQQSQTKCYRCGKIGHWAKTCEIAKGKICGKCGKIGHFQACCKTKIIDRQQVERNKPDKYGKNKKKWVPSRPKETVNLLQDNGSTSSDDEYVFALLDTQSFTIKVNLNDQQVDFLADTGATVNVINLLVWNKIRKDHQSLEPTSARIFSYGMKTPLQLEGEVTVKVNVADKCIESTFVVINGDFPCLLGKKTLVSLGLIEFKSNTGTIQVNTISSQIDIPQMDELLIKYHGLFTGMGKSKSIKVSVDIDPSFTPVAQPIRRIPHYVRDKVEAEIERLLQADIIEKASGPTPWLSPVVPVAKKDGSVRICLDTRELNRATIKQRYPIPLVDDILSELKQAAVISELDLKQGFHQFELDEQAKQLTAFATESGVYRYKRLIFGLNVAPEIFQGAVEAILGKLDGVRNLSDNIIVFGKNIEEHNKRLEVVFQKLQNDNLVLNKSKCKFTLNQLDFMGYVVSQKGIQLDDAKMQSVMDFVEPNTATEVRSFLGLVNFCSRFVPKVAELTAPLRELTKKGVRFEWNENHTRAFQELKILIAKSGQLVHFDKHKRIELIVDASPIGLGAVLTQEQTDGTLAPIAFANKVLSEQEIKYSQTEKEALAIIWACERFHLYLYGTKFTVRTDHKPLEIIYAAKSRPSARIERWVLRLQQYQYQVQYIKGENNIADPFSRLLNVSKLKKNNNDTTVLEAATREQIHFITTQAVPRAMILQDFITATAKDEQLMNVKTWITTGKWTEECKYFKQVKHELTWQDGILLRGTRIVVPKELQKQVLQIAHEAHQGTAKTKAMIRTKVWWPGIDVDIKNMVTNCVACQIQGPSLKPEPLQMSTSADKPWMSLAIDVCGPFYNGYYLIVLADYVTRWPEAILTKSTTTTSIIDFLETVFTCHGFPDCITSDNGAQFTSEEFVTFLKERGIKHRRVTPYWPQANGLVERMNKVFLKAFRAAFHDGGALQSALTSFLRVYRNTPHESTKVSPAQLLLGREPRFHLPILEQTTTSEVLTSALLHDENRKRKEKMYADERRRAQTSDLKKGDLVFLRQIRKHKLMSKFSPTVCRVLSKHGNALLLERPDLTTIRRNISHVRKAHGVKFRVNKDENEDTDLEDDDAQPVIPQALADNNIQQPPREMAPAADDRGLRCRRFLRAPAYLKDFVP